MARVDDDEAVTLRELFAGMDAADEACAVSAMNEAATFLQQHDLSFRKLVQEINARGLPLPSKIGAAIQLMDSTTLSEAESALAGARRLMRTCGLTFACIIGAIDREPAEVEEIEQLKLAYRIEAERSREMAAELEFLRANAVESSFQPVKSPLRNFAVVAIVLLGVVLASSIASTIADLFRSANATGTLHGFLTVQRANAERSSASRAGSICWRDRSTRGACF